MGRKVRKSRLLFFFLEYGLSLYDHQAKASRYGKGLIYLKNRATTNQNQTIHSQGLKRGHKHKIKGNHPTEKKREQRRNIELLENKV